jgi:uncharacterized protein YdeI (YjbR/CyaY-like superfamily)
MKQQGRFNPQFDEYQEAASDFAKPIMAHVRKLVHKQCSEVVEEIKWGVPHFDYKGEMLCIFAAYRNHCSFSFWKESLMSDARLKANPDLKAAKRFMGKLASLSDLPSDIELIAFVQEAMALNDKGVKLAPRQDAKPAFRKEYVVWIADAKTDQTRQKRIDESLEWIAEGKGRLKAKPHRGSSTYFFTSEESRLSHSKPVGPPKGLL